MLIFYELLQDLNVLKTAVYWNNPFLSDIYFDIFVQPFVPHFSYNLMNKFLIVMVCQIRRILKIFYGFWD